MQQRVRRICLGLIYSFSVQGSISSEATDGHTGVNDPILLVKSIPVLKRFESGDDEKNQKIVSSLFSWLNDVLGGKELSHPVYVYAYQKNDHSEVASSAVHKNELGKNIGLIRLNVDSITQKDERIVGTQARDNIIFLDMWFVMILEVSNLSAATEFQLIRDAALAAKIDREEYIRRTIVCEINSAKKAVQKMDSMIDLSSINVNGTFVDGWKKSLLSGLSNEDIYGKFPQSFEYHIKTYSEQFDEIKKKGVGGKKIDQTNR